MKKNSTKTTSSKLEARFDAGEDVLDYFDISRTTAHGGARTGAGRPALGKTRKTIKLSPQAIRRFDDHARRNGLGSFSAAVEEASAAYQSGASKQSEGTRVGKIPIGAKSNSWLVSIAAESAVAMVLARSGWNVSVQYGANQPEYDLLAEQNGSVLRVSVKGSQDGGWGLTQSLLADANYHAAADAWLARHSAKTIYAFAQFQGVDLTAAPRIYLAPAVEVAERLKQTANGRGDTILHERKVWSRRAFAAGTIDEIPRTWLFSAERLNQLVADLSASTEPKVDPAE
jgi:Holliday junction resolvase-like predicted endonuclease